MAGFQGPDEWPQGDFGAGWRLASGTNVPELLEVSPEREEDTHVRLNCPCGAVVK